MSVTSVYSKIPTKLPGTLTHPLPLANPASGSTGPSSSPGSCPLPTSVDCSLLLTAFFSLLLSSVHCPGTLPFLVFFRSRRKSRAQALCVGFAPKQTQESSDWHPHPQKRMPPIVPHMCLNLNTNFKTIFLCSKVSNLF